MTVFPLFKMGRAFPSLAFSFVKRCPFLLSVFFLPHPLVPALFTSLCGLRLLSPNDGEKKHSFFPNSPLNPPFFDSLPKGFPFQESSQV